MQPFDKILLFWLGLSTLLAFLLFGYDKVSAGRSGSRVPEFNLVLITKGKPIAKIQKLVDFISGDGQKFVKQ